jgi:hypothetical protein
MARGSNIKSIKRVLSFPLCCTLHTAHCTHYSRGARHDGRGGAGGDQVGGHHDFTCSATARACARIQLSTLRHRHRDGMHASQVSSSHIVQKIADPQAFKELNCLEKTLINSSLHSQSHHGHSNAPPSYALALTQSTMSRNANRRSSTTGALDIGGDWLEYLDDDTQQPYYMNQVTQEVTWDHPFPESANRRISQQQLSLLPEESPFHVEGTDEVDGGIDLQPEESPFHMNGTDEVDGGIDLQPEESPFHVDGTDEVDGGNDLQPEESPFHVDGTDEVDGGIDLQPEESPFHVEGTDEVDGGIDLPPGWSAWTDPRGEIYYTHEDGTSTWTRPGAAEFQPQPPTSADSMHTDVAILMQETSFDSALPSSSSSDTISGRPSSDYVVAFTQQRTPPPVPPRPRHLSQSTPLPHPLTKAAVSPKNTWSAGSSANLETLLQSFPSILTRLRGKLKSDHLPEPPASRPLSFAWYTIGGAARHQPVALDADVFDLGASLYYQSKGGLFKKSRTMEESLSYEALPRAKPTLQANRDAGESVIGPCIRCCHLVMLYMGDSDPSDMDKDSFNAINAASGSTRLVLIFREILDLVSSSVQLADEAYARVLKQLCNNYRAASVEAGWSLLLLLCSHVGCSDTMMRFLVLILNKCLAVERDLMSRATPNHWFAAHVAMFTISYRTTARANGEALSQFVDAEVENSFRKLKHLSPLYSFIEEIISLERKFRPAHSDFEILRFVPSTLVLLTDLIHTRGGFRTDGIFRLAGDRACVSRVRASISCRFPIVEADSDPLVIAEVISKYLCESLLALL